MIFNQTYFHMVIIIVIISTQINVHMLWHRINWGSCRGFCIRSWCCWWCFCWLGPNRWWEHRYTIIHNLLSILILNDFPWINKWWCNIGIIGSDSIQKRPNRLNIKHHHVQHRFFFLPCRARHDSSDGRSRLHTILWFIPLPVCGWRTHTDPLFEIGAAYGLWKGSAIMENAILPIDSWALSILCKKVFCSCHSVIDGALDYISLRTSTGYVFALQWLTVVAWRISREY